MVVTDVASHSGPRSWDYPRCGCGARRLAIRCRPRGVERGEGGPRDRILTILPSLAEEGGVAASITNNSILSDAGQVVKVAI
jgi:hypothetical protein